MKTVLVIFDPYKRRLQFSVVAFGEYRKPDNNGVTPLSDRYTIYCVYHDSFTDDKRKLFIHKHKHALEVYTMTKVKPRMTNEEVKRHLSEYDELGFDSMPGWLKLELQARNITFEKRRPTDLEQWETVSDAREHRILNNEKTIKDFQDKYIRGKSFSLLT